MSPVLQLATLPFRILFLQVRVTSKLSELNTHLMEADEDAQISNFKLAEGLERRSPVQSTCHSYRGLRFGSQHPHGNAQPSVTLRETDMHVVYKQTCR